MWESILNWLLKKILRQQHLSSDLMSSFNLIMRSVAIGMVMLEDGRRRWVKIRFDLLKEMKKINEAEV